MNKQVIVFYSLRLRSERQREVAQRDKEKWLRETKRSGSEGQREVAQRDKEKWLREIVL